MIKNLRQTLAGWLIKKIQKHGPHTVKVLGKTYALSEQVFNPKFYFTSEFMARNIRVGPEDTVLDMGTGCGIQAVTAGKRAARVVAVDINPEAVRYARENAKANGVGNVVSVREGDLFSPLAEGEKFDVILFTPPYFQGEPASHFENALYDPGKKLIRRFFTDAKKHLLAGGYVQMIYSSMADSEKALAIAEQLGWTYRVLAEEKTYTETFLIYKLTPV